MMAGVLSDRKILITGPAGQIAFPLAQHRSGVPTPPTWPASGLR
jgi:hypothetical protein